mmetsp:Transcript_18698/g.52551  ORF Transcript_18698/g.52551 Transcript_18698/m.52551 type:complete len:565 (+) Transcript_18698:861-2555(+)
MLHTSSKHLVGVNSKPTTPNMLGAAKMLARSAGCSPILRGSVQARGILQPGQQRGLQQQVQQSRMLSQTRVTAQNEPAGPGAPRVVVIGGGFGGLYTAVRLSELFWPRNKMPQVTLVDQSERFVFKPLLYELLTGGADENEVAPSFLQLLAPYPVRYIQAKVSGAEPEELQDGGSSSGGRVILDDGTDVEYDWLVVALGSQANDRGIPGVKELAVPFNTFEDAQRTVAALEDIETRTAYGSEAANITIVGAGYSGVELAASVSERLRSKPGGSSVRVQLLTPGQDILEGSPAGQRETAMQALSSLGVEIITGMRVRSLERSADATSTPTAVTMNLERSQAEDPSSSRESRAADLVLWTAGNAPSTKDLQPGALPTPQQRKGFPFPTNERGSVLTEPSLRVRKHSNVFALGDVSVSGSEEGALPATAQVAFQQADYAAWNVWASINGRPLLPFRYQHLGNMMGLGAVNGAVALPVSLPGQIGSSLQSSPLGPLLSGLGVKLGAGGNPEADGITLEGPLAAAARRAAYLYRQPTNEQRMSVAAGWLNQASNLASSLLGQLPSQQAR